MARVENPQQLRVLRDELRERERMRRAKVTRILVGMGTCGIAAGARDVTDAITKELEHHHIDAQVVPVGCIGICQMEPIVDIEGPGLDRVTYRNVQPEMVPRLIEEHIVHGRILTEWAVARLHPEGL